MLHFFSKVYVIANVRLSTFIINKYIYKFKLLKTALLNDVLQIFPAKPQSQLIL